MGFRRITRNAANRFWVDCTPINLRDTRVFIIAEDRRCDGSKGSIRVPEGRKYDARNLLRCPDDNSSELLILAW